MGKSRSLLRKRPKHTRASVRLQHVQAAWQKGDIANAYELGQRLRRKKPRDPEVLWLWAQICTAAGKIDDAQQAYEQLLKRDAEHVGALINLANLLHRPASATTRAMATAIKFCARACVLAPEMPEAHYNHGVALHRAGRPAAAAAAFGRTTELRDWPPAWVCLSAARLAMGNAEAAADAARHAIELASGAAESWYNLGNALGQLSQTSATEGVLDEALHAYRQCTDRNPHHLGAWNNSGRLFLESGDLQRAVAHFRSALAIAPQTAELHNNLGVGLRRLGDFDAAVTSFRQALHLQPCFPTAHSNLLFALCHLPDTDIDGAELLRQHQAWDESQSDRARSFPPLRSIGERRRLRLGYLSPDFRNHPVMLFAEPLIRRQCQAAAESTAGSLGGVDIFCYADVPTPDHRTAALQATVGTGWRDIAGLTDDQVRRQIADDKIDILIDLAGHTQGNRMPLFAARAAPLQMTHIMGYGQTTGLQMMDYVITDRCLTNSDEPREVEQYSEQPIYLPDYVCFEAPAGLAPVFLRDEKHGGTVFACCVDPSRIDIASMTVWSRVLQRVPHSVLRLVHPRYADRTVVDRLQHLGAACGLGDADTPDSSPSRVQFETVQGSWADNMQVYAKIDVALDPLTLSGGTPTIFALLMGIPVVSRYGPLPRSRVAASFLRAAGCGQWVAVDEEEYVAIAEQLVADRPALRTLRGTLRQQLQDSPLFNSRQHAVDFNALMWRTWTTAAGLAAEHAPGDKRLVA